MKRKCNHRVTSIARFSYLNGDGASSDVEVVAADGLGGVPLALPVELAGEVPPEGGRILDGLLVHLLILHRKQNSGRNGHAEMANTALLPRRAPVP